MGRGAIPKSETLGEKIGNWEVAGTGGFSGVNEGRLQLTWGPATAPEGEDGKEWSVAEQIIHAGESRQGVIQVEKCRTSSYHGTEKKNAKLKRKTAPVGGGIKP